MSNVISSILSITPEEIERLMEKYHLNELPTLSMLAMLISRNKLEEQIDELPMREALTSIKKIIELGEDKFFLLNASLEVLLYIREIEALCIIRVFIDMLINKKQLEAELNVVNYCIKANKQRV